MSARSFCWVMFGMVPVLLLLAAAVPPFDDELYYWCWSRDLQFSYYDHPPMVAYMIRLSTELFGDSILSIRLPGALSGLVVIGVIGWLSRPRALFPLVLFSPVLTYAAILVTPDTPLLMFWALYLAWLVKTHERLERVAEESPFSSLEVRRSLRPLSPWWLLGGVILGCGVLGKYTMGLAAMTGGVSFLFAGNWRRWVPGYIVHALISFVVASPILIHNLPHNFEPIRYQWTHAMGSPKPGLIPFAEFVGVQLLLFGGVPFVVLVWGFRHWRELVASPRLRVCACLFLLPFAFFLFKSTRGRLEGNWAFPAFIACWPLAEVWFSRAQEWRAWRLATYCGFAIPIGFSLVLTLHLVHPLSLLPPKADRAYRQWGRMEAAKAAAEDLRASGYAGPVYAPTYQWVALLRWYGVDARQIDSASRPSQFTIPPESPSGLARAVICAEGLLPKQLATGLTAPQLVSQYPVMVRGEQCQVLMRIEYSAAKVVDPSKASEGRLDHSPAGPPP